MDWLIRVGLTQLPDETIASLEDSGVKYIPYVLSSLYPLLGFPSSSTR